MASGSERYVATRRQLQQVAESLIVGPQWRTAATIRLAVTPGGFAGTAIAVEVLGTELVWSDGRAELTGPVRRIVTAAGIDAGPPDGVYPIDDPLRLDDRLELDGVAAAWLHRAHHCGARALDTVFPGAGPVLWPEHFDVAVAVDEVTYGVSAGDGFHPLPYAYVGPPTMRHGALWNAPFGALHPLDADLDVDALTSQIADFFERGAREVRS
jgi:hypothetical protein